MDNSSPNAVYTDSVSAQSQAPPEYLFSMHPSRFKNTQWKYVGAVGLIVLAIIGFISFILSPHYNPASSGLLGMLVVFAINMVSSARNDDKAPREIMVGPYGLRVKTKKDTITYAWTDLGWSMISKNSWTSRKELNIYNKQGKAFLKVEDTIQYFDYLVQIVNHNISLQGDQSTERIRISKAKRNGVISVAGGCFILLIGIANLWIAHDSQVKENQFKTQGKIGRAQIINRFVAPNGINHLITYQIKGENGKVGTHDAQVSRGMWEMLGDMKTVPVRYVPTDPNNTRLLVGERKEADFDPIMMYLISIGVSIMALVFITAGIFSYKGYDLTFDQKTFKLRVKKYGDS